MVQDLEKQENYFQSYRDCKHSELQADISELERQITNYSDNKNLSDGLRNSYSELVEKVDLMKKVNQFQQADLLPTPFILILFDLMILNCCDYSAITEIMEHVDRCGLMKLWSPYGCDNSQNATM